MDTLIRAECAKLIEDWKQKAFEYDGLIYMMLAEEPEGVVPLYIGKENRRQLPAPIGKARRLSQPNERYATRQHGSLARYGQPDRYPLRVLLSQRCG